MIPVTIRVGTPNKGVLEQKIRADCSHISLEIQTVQRSWHDRLGSSGFNEVYPIDCLYVKWNLGRCERHS